MNDNPKTGLLSVREKMGYAVGDFACDLFFMFFIYYALFFYTDVFGIPAAVVGTMFLVTKLWDAVNDPLMGIIADRTKTKWGKFRPYILWMAIPYGIIGVLTFSSPEVSMAWKIVYAYVTYTLINMVYTAINIPYSALSGVMTSNSKDRTSLVSFRFVAAYAGGICVTTLTIPLAGMYGGGSNDVIIAQALPDHKIEITETGIGTVQLKGDFVVKPDDAVQSKAKWLSKVQGWYQGKDHVETIEKTTTIWVKPKEAILNQIFYEEEGRAKALAALIELDRQKVLTALANLAPSVKEEDTEKLSRQLAKLDRDALGRALSPVSFGGSKVMELEMDGNFYLESGFGKKQIDAKLLWDDTGENHDVWAPPEKVDWSLPVHSINIIDQQHGFQFTIGTFAFVAMIMFFITFASTRERVHPPQNQNTAILKDLRIVLTNRNWIVVGVMSLFVLAFVCIYGAAIMYYFKYYVGSLTLAAAFMGVGTVTNLLGVLATPFLTKVMGSKKKVYFVNSMVMAGIYVCYYFPGPDDVAILIGLSAIGGFASGPLSPIVWAMYADIADHAEWKNGTRATGLFFSAATFAQKMGWTLGGAVSGWLLAWWGFEANIVQSEETINGIKTLLSWIPASLAFIAGVLVLLYTLDDKLMVKIEKELKARRAKEESA